LIQGRCNGDIDVYDLKDAMTPTGLIENQLHSEPLTQRLVCSCLLKIHYPQTLVHEGSDGMIHNVALSPDAKHLVAVNYADSLFIYTRPSE
jgi:hypothetical protein